MSEIIQNTLGFERAASSKLPETNAQHYAIVESMNCSGQRNVLDHWAALEATNSCISSRYIIGPALLPMEMAAAAKAGIIGFTKALARESANKNITVNAIAPGYVMTDMMSTVPQEFLDKIINLIPMSRLGKPEDIARAILFLVSKEASYITGETISINGGHNMF